MVVEWRARPRKEVVTALYRPDQTTGNPDHEPGLDTDLVPRPYSTNE
jgi:hypothetical protein